MAHCDGNHGLGMEGLTESIHIAHNMHMANHIGLESLYARFGSKPFRGTPLREVMIQVIGGPTMPKAAWQASLALGRLVKSEVVDVIAEGNPGERSWGNTYQINAVGLALMSKSEEAALVDAGVEWLAPPGTDAFLDKLNVAEGPMAVRGTKWQRWAQLDWAMAHGLVSVEYVARVSITSLGSKYAEGIIADVREVSGGEGGPRSGARITAKVYHAIRALDRNPTREGVMPEELAEYLGMPYNRVERQLSAAIDNGYVVVRSDGYHVVFGEEK